MKILSGMSLTEIEELVLNLKASKFRAKQIHNWIYLKSVATIDEMTDLSKQFREEFSINKTDSLRDYFTSEELRAIQSKEMLVSSLINCGWGYEQIKNFIQDNTMKMIS